MVIINISSTTLGRLRLSVRVSYTDTFMSLGQTRLFYISCFRIENYHVFVMVRQSQAQNYPLPLPFQAQCLVLLNFSVIFLKFLKAFGCHSIEHLS